MKVVSASEEFHLVDDTVVSAGNEGEANVQEDGVDATIAGYKMEIGPVTRRK